MEEEVMKRYTDCVYFLASPLTCKNGIKCEYRHSEIARLNPRDCWYWLAGSCFNPSCGFRHPPLDIHTELSEHASSKDQRSISMKKVEAPCYFYFSGFCKKGHKCSFLHGPNDASKLSKTAPAISDVPQLENKTSAWSNTVPAAIETLPISSEAALKLSAGSQVKPKEDVNSPEFKGQIASPHASTWEFEEAPVARLPDRENSIQSESIMYTYQSSEEQVDVHLRENDWLESSPGFDVLVDGRSHNLSYEDEAEYLVGIERDGGEVNDHFLGYDYEDYAEYARILHDERRIDSCTKLDDDIDEQGYPILRRDSGYEDENMYPNSIRKRELLPVSLPIDSRRGVDVRSYLREHGATDDSRLPCFSERNNSSLKKYHSHEKSWQDHRPKYGIGKFCENKRLFKASGPSGRFRKSYPIISIEHYKENRQSGRSAYSSGIRRKPVTRKKVTEEYSFSRPKTLDQIKKEKRRGTRHGESCGNSGCFSKKSEDFQGPKPLSEILKDKRKLHSVDVNHGIS